MPPSSPAPGTAPAPAAPAVRLTDARREGKAAVGTLRCLGAPGQLCQGRLRLLTRNGTLIASTSYAIPALDPRATPTTRVRVALTLNARRLVQQRRLRLRLDTGAPRRVRPL